MKQKISVLFLLCTLWLASAVPAPAYVPDGLTAADWQAIQSLVPGSYLKASNTGANDRFGSSVAVDGDTLVVGTPFEDSNATGVDGNQGDNSATQSGAVYVFTRSGGVWSQQAYLKASNTEEFNCFGESVAVSGDTVVVGAPCEESNATGVNGDQADNSASGAGAAYVFSRNDGVWSQQAYLKASNTGAGDNFGIAVAVDGDTVVVGACQEASNATGVDGDQGDDSAFEAGAAYVFVRSSGVWSQQAYLKASNTDIGDFFGIAVAVDGNTVVIGADNEDSNATGVNGNQGDNSAFEAGAAYIFTRSGGVWSQQAYLKTSNTDAFDGFGGFVAISGDTMVGGAKGEDSNTTGVNGNQGDNSALDSGAAYVFTRSGGVWSQQAYLKASNTQNRDKFGSTVAVSDGTVVVGAYEEDSNATGVNGNQGNNLALDSGAAYVFIRSGEVWSQQAYLKASNTEELDYFGYAMAVSGDTVVVGTIWEDSNAMGVNGDQTNNSATNAGAVYTFEPTSATYPLTIIPAGTGTGSVVSIPAGIDCGVTCTVQIAAGTVVTLTATADAGATFINWSGTFITTTNPITIAMNSPQGVTATFARNHYELTLATDGNGLGSVENDPAGTLFEDGTVVTLTATADLGSTFTGWSGDLITTTNPMTLTIDSAKTVTATFTLNQYELTLATAGNGSGSVGNDPVGTLFDYGTVVTLTATADVGSTFTGWSGDLITTTNPITLTINGAKSITATFALNQYELTLATAGNGSGSVGSNPVGVLFDYGTVVTLTATADVGSTFTGWNGDLITTTNPITLTMDEDKSVTATFALNQYELTLATVGNGSGNIGSNPVGVLFDYGTVVTLTTTADVGSTFTGWSGDLITTTNPITLTINGAKSITATFALNQYELTLATAGNGSGNVANNPTGTLFEHGTVVTLTATADVGSTFTGWSGSITSTDPAIMVTMDEAKSITATFALDAPPSYRVFLPLVMAP